MTSQTTKSNPAPQESGAEEFSKSIHAVVTLSISKAVGVQRALEKLDKLFAQRNKQQRKVETWEEDRAEIIEQTSGLIAVDLFSRLADVLIRHDLHDQVVTRAVNTIFASKTEK